MRVAVLTNNGFVLREAPRPDCGVGQVLVRTVACGVCSSDIDRYRVGLGGKAEEVILGHEGSGYVAAVGRGVQAFREGDPVTSLHGPYAEYFVTTPETLARLLSTGVRSSAAIGSGLGTRIVKDAVERCTLNGMRSKESLDLAAVEIKKMLSD